MGLHEGKARGAAFSSAYSITSDSLDGGGTHSGASDYAVDPSLSVFGGLVASPAYQARQGYPGTLNDPPAAMPDLVECEAGMIVKVSLSQLLGNDADLDADLLRDFQAGAGQTTQGTLSRLGDWIFYNAPSNFTGEDSFVYSISDGVNDPVTAVVRVHISSGPTDGPAAHLAIEPLPGGGLRLSFAAYAGKAYRIEYRDSLDEASPWQVLTTFPEGNAEFQFFEDTAGVPIRFYRVVEIVSP